MGERIMYKKVLLAYDGSIEGRLALREGAKLAQLCHADVFLLAVVELSSGSVAMEGGFVLPVEDQISSYKKILAEGVERLKAMGFSPTARLGTGDAGQVITQVAHEIEANLVVVGHRQQGPLARWLFGSTDNYLINHLRCSVLVMMPQPRQRPCGGRIGRGARARRQHRHLAGCPIAT
jgi:nucleotide-binding universal stress UspA family protein